MGYDPLTVGLMSLFDHTGPTNPPSSPVQTVEGSYTQDKKKARKYRPAAQLFRDEDLRLGIAGRLGG